MSVRQKLWSLLYIAIPLALFSLSLLVFRVDSASAQGFGYSSSGLGFSSEDAGIGVGQYWADFGDGSDGTCTFDGSSTVPGFTGPSGNIYTQTRAVYCENATLNSLIEIDQFTPFAYLHVRDTFTWNGGIGANGALGLSGNAGGTGGVNATSLTGNGGNGGDSSTGGTPSNLNAYCVGNNLNGFYGGGGSGIASGGLGAENPTDYATIFTGLHTSVPWLNGWVTSTYLGGSTPLQAALCGGLGGGGGGGGTPAASQYGGGGGAGGGISYVAARILKGNGSQTCNGGNGGAGGTGDTGGGGGGAGGACIIEYSTDAGFTIFQTATGGTGGAGSSGGNAGQTGADGFTMMLGPG